MLVVRGTKKLRERVPGTGWAFDDVSTTALGDWFATALMWKPQVALLLNERTFIPVLMPLAPKVSWLDRVAEAIAEALHAHGADASFVDAELAAMRDVRLGPTNDPTVVRMLTEFTHHGKWRWQRGSSLQEIALELSDMPIGPLRDRTGSPRRELAALLNIARGGTLDHTPTGSTALVGDRPVTSVIRLKVTLARTRPSIWRRLLVSGSATLDEVHEVIQASFGWSNYHMYDFEIAGSRFGIPDPDWDSAFPVRDARRTKLQDVAPLGATLSYTYDFGDLWKHTIVVEEIGDPVAGGAVPSCIEGRRAGPPEDCGGVSGYEDLLSVLADPSHPSHQELIEWLGGPAALFDPDAFDPNHFAANLRAIRHAQHRRNGGW